MGKFKDLTGQKFGKLTVIKRGEDYVYPNGKRRIQWWCECDCSNKNMVLVAANNLTSGHTISCGCAKIVSHRFEDLTGRIFGRWHVVKRGENGSYNRVQWWCWCDCQRELPEKDRELHLVSSSLLKSKKSTSCGCYAKELLTISKRGNKYSLKDHSASNDDFWAYSPGESIKTNTGNITITKRYYEKGGDIKNYRGKYYYYTCDICGYECDDEHIIYESNLKRGSGCAECATKISGIFAIKKICDYAQWMVQYLKNKDDANIYGIGSNDYIDVVCPECGYEDKKIISTIYRNGFHCHKCDDGISYPEKFVKSALEQLGVEFIYQLSKRNLEWVGKYRYDFYLPNLNMIIETHGGQHYYEGFTTGRTLKEEQENDKIKSDLALSNGITEYITIDCRESNKQWISSSINKELSAYFDLQKVSYDKCEECALKTIVKQVCDYYMNNNKPKTSCIAEVFDIDKTTVIKYLKQGADLKWCDYVPRPKYRRIRVYNDGVFIGDFEKIKDFIQYAKERFGIDIASHSVTSACQGKIKHTHGFVCEYIN